MSEVRIQLGAKRSAVAEDHLWARVSGGADAAVAPALLDTLPVAERYLVVVPPERVSFFRLALPAGPQRRVLAALPYQIEDRLLEPVEHYEFARVDGHDEPGFVCLAVFERDWLHGVRAALARIARGEVRWVVAGWGWPAADPAVGPTAWRLRADADRVSLCRGGPEVVSLPPAQLEDGLEMALAAERENRPGALLADAEPALAERLGDWARRHQLDFRAVRLPDAWRADYGACPWSLFQQRRSRLRQAVGSLRAATVWRPLVWTGGVLCALELGASLTAWGVLSARVGAQQREAAALLRAVAGPAVPVVDPLLQMRRHYQARRHAEGLRSGDDFIALLSALSADLPDQFGRAAEIAYERGQLRLVFDAAAAPAALRSEALGRLRAAGWAADATLSPDQRRWTLQAGRS